MDPNRDLNPAFYSARVRDRQIHEMLGLLKGMVCDGLISDDEIFSFKTWLIANPLAATTWPGEVLARRVIKIHADGVIDVTERHELYELFCDTAGGGGSPEATKVNRATRLPFDDPPPAIVFNRDPFVLTGAFVYGPREKCEQAIEDRGGHCLPRLVKQPLTLVVGMIGSNAWIQSGFGRKIETAMKHRESGVPISIVSEERWTEALTA